MNPFGEEINKSVITEMEATFVIFLIEKYSENGWETHFLVLSNPQFILYQALSPLDIYNPLTETSASFFKATSTA